MCEFPLRGKAPSIVITIWMAGDIEVAKQACREVCLGEGLCVTVTSTEFIYTGGAESGFSIGLINYPRFPSGETDLLAVAKRLATRVAVKCHQHSYCVCGPSETLWFSRRADH